ncbi:MAG: hypothetical protein AVDCRST_MAG54-1369, partial [uncultured Actinomycetospora sp.]
CRRSSATPARTSWPRTRSATPSTRRCSLTRRSRTRAGRSTSCGSASSTRRRTPSIPTGTRWPTPRSTCCAPTPAATPTTAASPTWSASCPPAARSSA